jgi:hypothetical protein
MLHRRWALVLIAAFAAVGARAQGTPQVTEIYKCVDANGRPNYTNDKRETSGKKCELVTRQVNIAPAPPAPPPRSAAARPGSFPRETAAERSIRSASSRQILEQELATEQEALAKARQDLAAAEGIREGGERNYARVLERLQPYKDSIETHEKNIEALKRELGSLQR